MDLDEIPTIPLGDPRYPAALAAIHDPPPLLWTRGRIESLHGPMVAVVGSRAASPYALQVARKLGADLARRKVTVVSGMARGVDSAAHEGALDGGGVTVAVFGCGVDVIYPPEHAPLAARICERGALVSEFPPGTPPLPAYFPQRNRIISGLVAGGGDRRGGGKERVAHHRALRAGPGARSAGGARQHPRRPQFRRARAAARRCKDRGVRGRYSGGDPAGMRDWGVGTRDRASRFGSRIRRRNPRRRIRRLRIQSSTT